MKKTIETKPTETDAFEIGLVMAGAVSAGAYTAGVIDYLLEVLQAWEDAREETTTPSHKVRIKVITGASAGGMVAAITAAELLRRAKAKSSKTSDYTQSLLYKAWVEEIDIEGLLENSDLKTKEPFYSFLNSDLLDQIADKMIYTNGETPTYTKLPDYIDPELKMYLTLSNLRGLPYEFDLNGESGLPYGMTDHADYQYFQLCKQTSKQDWHKLRKAAVATGAFPVGFKARLIERDTSEYKERIAKNGLEISAKLKLNTSQATSYPFVVIDGGALNNEPIELARSVWAKKTKTPPPNTDLNAATYNSKEYLKHVKAVEGESRLVSQYNLEPGKNALIIIDPFPNFADVGQEPTAKDTKLSAILLPIISAIRSQNLFKPEEMIMACDKENYTRFLIAPLRRNKEGSIASKALACGIFGGFGGFLSQDFRKHDYHLGRKNAQRFLTHHFVFPKKYIDALPFANAASIKSNDSGDIPMIPIIPGTAVEQKQGEDNDWPSYSKTKLHKLSQLVNARINILTQRLPLVGTFSQKWTRFTAIGMLLFILFGEWVKYNSDITKVFCPFLNGLYILVFQIVLSVLLSVLILLMVSKAMIDKRATKETIKYVKGLITEWGIEIKK